MAARLGARREEDHPMLPGGETERGQELQATGLDIGEDDVGVGVEDAEGVLVRIGGDADDLDARVLPQLLGQGVAQVPFGDQDEGAHGASGVCVHDGSPGRRSSMHQTYPSSLWPKPRRLSMRRIHSISSTQVRARMRCSARAGASKGPGKRRR